MPLDGCGDGSQAIGVQNTTLLSMDGPGEMTRFCLHPHVREIRLQT